MNTAAQRGVIRCRLSRDTQPGLNGLPGQETPPIPRRISEPRPLVQFQVLGAVGWPVRFRCRSGGGCTVVGSGRGNDRERRPKGLSASSRGVGGGFCSRRA